MMLIGGANDSYQNGQGAFQEAPQVVEDAGTVLGPQVPVVDEHDDAVGLHGGWDLLPRLLPLGRDSGRARAAATMP